MGNWMNWLLVIGGVVCVIAELALGVLTGFDLALIGASMIAGGAIGLVFGSSSVGLLAAGILAFAYLAFFRRWLRAKLNVRVQASNIDAVVGKSGVVVKRVASREPGQVKVGDEVWRAELAQTEAAARNPGDTVTVESAEGVTLKVR